MTNKKHIEFTDKYRDFDGVIPLERCNRYKQFYWKSINNWVSELKVGNGQYYSILKPMYNQKLKELHEQLGAKKIERQEYVDHKNIINASFYHIYYKVRFYFDEFKIPKAEHRTINGFDFYADIYTFCHILSRHYIPNMNDGIGGDLNKEIPYMNVFELPSSILDLIEKSTKGVHLDKSLEYFLFSMDGDKYILWVKYGKIGILQNAIGFEVRSFYRCTSEADLNKFEGKHLQHIESGLYIYL